VDGPTGGRVARDLSRRFGTLVTVVSATPEGVREGEGIVRIVRKPYSDQCIQAAIEHAEAASRPARREPSRRDDPSGSLATLSRAVAND
jgi:FixJ family two-component response regulator